MELSGHNNQEVVSSHEMRSRRDQILGNINNNHNGTNYTTTQTLIDHTTSNNITTSRHQQNPQSGRSPTTQGGGSTAKQTNVRYRECLRNHAASVGGNVYDGCGEFMPSGEEGKLEALKCAACDCHRNFHRKEVDGEVSAAISPFSPSSRRVPTLQLPPPPVHHHHHGYGHGHHQRYANAPNVVVQPVNTVAPFGGGAGTESSSEDLNVFHSNNHVEGVSSMPPPILPPYVLSKKRFRTKFTQEQKDKMMEFAEKVGWRINKQDDVELERFCAEVGVRRQVFKVWMHNNKNLKRQQQQQEAESRQLPQHI